ncbi:MAG: hypothetical protein HXX81_00315 [Campylobacterales bacterium]|nr:hypothetical protein [Campylobacterales bacterium]
MQTTLVWKMPLSIENFNFSFEGFVDKTSQDIIYQPQILLDMACIGMNKNKVFAGVEFYGYRHDDLDIAEFKPQLMIKAVW